MPNLKGNIGHWPEIEIKNNVLMSNPYNFENIRIKYYISCKMMLC